jgi:CheY-like chemotaxis protein
MGEITYLIRDKQPLPVCFFSGTVVLVDDNASFLDSLRLSLTKVPLQRVFTSPKQALDFFQHEYKPTLMQAEWLSIDETVDSDNETSQSVKLHIPNIHQLIYSAARFKEIPVVIVDYSMPGINGLEFCQALQGKPLRKVMLTGEADFDIAVKGFNQGVIDQFIMKSAIDELGTQLTDVIHQMQWHYFQTLSQPILEQLALQAPVCLLDPAFIKHFQVICAEHSISEFYMLERSGSFLLLNSAGVGYWLIVKTARDLDNYADIAKNTDGAPECIVSALQQYRQVPYFYTDQDHQTHVEHWSKFMHDAQCFTGEQTYYYALLKLPGHYGLDLTNIVSLEKVLA